MKKLIFFLAALFALPTYAASPCIWGGEYVKCLPESGIFLDDGRGLYLSPDTDATHYVNLQSADSMTNGYTLKFPAAGPGTGQALYSEFGTAQLNWYTPFTTTTFTDYKTSLPMKYSAAAASTANIASLSGDPGLVDGVDFSSGGNLLLKNQTTKSENGLWLVNPFGAWTRDSTMPDNTSSALSSVIGVDLGGTVNGGTIWFARNNGGDIDFVQIPTTNTNAPLTSGLDLVTTTGGRFTTNTITGTGDGVRANTPTLITPVLGVATATSINKMAITAPASGSTLAVADGKTFTVNQTMTFNGTSGTAFTFPSTSQSLVGATNAIAVSNKTLDNSNSYTSKAGQFALQDDSDTTKQALFDLSGISTATARGYTFPNASGTLALTSNKLSAFASTTSSELAGVISNETGSGALVFGTSPTFTTSYLLAGSSSGTTTVQATAAASGTLTLPAVTDTLAVKGANTFTAAQTISDATDATSTSTGAAIVSGGIGVAKAVYAGTVSTFTQGIKVKNTGAGSTTLSWYEEGTWTPAGALVTAGNSSNSNQVGHFTRIGNRVFISGSFVFTKGTGTGSFSITSTGLPAASSTANLYQALTIYGDGGLGNNGGRVFQARTQLGSTTFYIGAWDEGGAAGAITTANDTYLSTTATIYITGSYEI